MKTVIIKYNSGNTASVGYALERIGINAIVSDDPDLIASADKVIIPGVGEASCAMNYLREKRLDQALRSLKQPVLGICLGMQLLCTSSEEGNTNCLGLIDAKVLRFGSSLDLKVPQIGWNKIRGLKGKLFDGIKEEEYVYFVHGFYVEENGAAIALTEYGKTYCSAVQRNNFYGLQFHPEKSGIAGSKIIENFIKI